VQHTPEKPFCARELLHSSLGIAVVSQFFSSFAHRVRRLLVRNDGDQLCVPDDVRRVLCPLDPDQMGARPALEPEIGTCVRDRAIGEFEGDQFFAFEGDW
jgi:hypothetical protein